MGWSSQTQPLPLAPGLSFELSQSSGREPMTHNASDPFPCLPALSPGEETDSHVFYLPVSPVPPRVGT